MEACFLSSPSVHPFRAKCRFLPARLIVAQLMQPLLTFSAHLVLLVGEWRPCHAALFLNTHLMRQVANLRYRESILQFSRLTLQITQTSTLQFLYTIGNGASLSFSLPCMHCLQAIDPCHPALFLDTQLMRGLQEQRERDSICSYQEASLVCKVLQRDHTFHHGFSGAHRTISGVHRLEESENNPE